MLGEATPQHTLYIIQYKGKIMRHIEQYKQSGYTPVPGKFTLFLRRCILWQIVQFAWINLKMTVLIVKSHH